ncbi:MAG: hypothetical protein N2645_05035 [Clostridia bacterium]|nr:hypothetical protein [Clostridia bacterium]
MEKIGLITNKLNEVLRVRKNKIHENKKKCPFCFGQNEKCSFLEEALKENVEKSSQWAGLLFPLNEEGIGKHLQFILEDVEGTPNPLQRLIFEEMLYEKVSNIEERIYHQGQKGVYFCSDLLKTNEILNKELESVTKLLREEYHKILSNMI